MVQILGAFVVQPSAAIPDAFVGGEIDHIVLVGKIRMLH